MVSQFGREQFIFRRQVRIQTVMVGLDGGTCGKPAHLSLYFLKIDEAIKRNAKIRSNPIIFFPSNRRLACEQLRPRNIYRDVNTLGLLNLKAPTQPRARQADIMQINPLAFDLDQQTDPAKQHRRTMTLRAKSMSRRVRKKMRSDAFVFARIIRFHAGHYVPTCYHSNPITLPISTVPTTYQ